MRSVTPTAEQRVLGGVIYDVAAGASQVIQVSGTQGIVVYSAGDAGTYRPCRANGTACPGTAAAAPTLGDLLDARSTHIKIAAGADALEVHVIG